MNKSDFSAFLNNKEFVLLDGAMGTMLLAEGLQLGESSEVFAINRPDMLSGIHRRYIAAGSDIIYACTFGANRFKLPQGFAVADVISRAVKIAKEAAADKALVALDIGSVGELLEPAGTLKFADAYAAFAEMMTAGAAAGADIIVIETMTDLYELKAALLAAKECTDLPVVCSMTFDKNLRTFNGCRADAFAITATALGADAIGVNCSPGPVGILPIIEEIARHTNLPLLAKANAGLPDPQTGAYSLSPADFAEQMRAFARLGVKMLGGCCGTSPEYIAALKAALATETCAARPIISEAAVCSATHTVYLNAPRIVGERLNPTGKKQFQQALRDENMDYILSQAISQQQAGADILDVNVGLPGIDEPRLMAKVVQAMQATVDLPLQLDSSDPAALEAGLRAANGKVIINSVNGKAESLAQILPLAAKYGAAVIGLCLDEAGLPETAEARLAIARRIMDAATNAGIKKEDIYIDCLTLTVSAQQDQAMETLAAIRAVKQDLGLKTVLGVSNISFGLPNRPLLNQTFLTMALSAGLDLAIINPNSRNMTDTVAAFKVLANFDTDSVAYIAAQTEAANETATSITSAAPTATDIDPAAALNAAIKQGLKGEARNLTETLLAQMDELTIINTLLIPALDEVGLAFEQEKIFLPQLINAAGAAGAAFDLLKERIAAAGTAPTSAGTILMATVFGDIHDIGKNIVKVILENYGYRVIDLGRDVPAEEIVKAAIEGDIRLIGLSALMTTTVPSMQQTIKLLRQSGHDAKVFVGGAVLTADYAEEIGADFYAKDANASVAIAKQVLG